MPNRRTKAEQVTKRGRSRVMWGQISHDSFVSTGKMSQDQEILMKQSETYSQFYPQVFDFKLQI
jgi:hypothetical protein